MVGFLVFIICLCVVHVISVCTKEFVFDQIYKDSRLIKYSNMITLDSNLICALKCVGNEYCRGFSYQPSSGRCEHYDEVVSTALAEPDYGTMTYKASRVCCPPPNIPNTNTPPPDQYYLPGHFMLYDCIINTYQNTSIVCLEDGTWNTSYVRCQYVKTCDEAAFLGVSVGSDLVVKPIASMSTVIVKCEYNFNEDNYWTVIDTTWDNNTLLSGHESIRSGLYNVAYTIELHFIAAIADSSTFCTQYMKFICYQCHMIDNGWNTRDGSLADYFFGGIKGEMNCACNLDNSCNGGYKCNCESNDGVLRYDEGFSTYKDDLPVTAFLSGDTGGSDEYAYVLISSLRCNGILD